METAERTAVKDLYIACAQPIRTYTCPLWLGTVTKRAEHGEKKKAHIYKIIYGTGAIAIKTHTKTLLQNFHLRAKTKFFL